MKKFLLFGFCLFLFACGRSTPTNYYLLEGNAHYKETSSLTKKNLRIAQVEVADYLNRNNIISRVNGETRLILAEFHIWAEPVASGVRRVLEETLTGPLADAGITVLSSNSESRNTYTLLIDIQRFDGNFNENAILEAKWTLLDENEKAIERGMFAAEEMVNGADYNVLVQTESSLIRNFGNQLAKVLPRLINKSTSR